jgi:hypothetical protein
VLDKQLQHTLQLGYIPHVEVKSVSALVRVAIAEVSHSVKLVRQLIKITAVFGYVGAEMQQHYNTSYTQRVCALHAVV